MNPREQALFDEVHPVVRLSRKAGNDVRIDYSKWSNEARSSSIAFLDEFHSHTPYKCRACNKSCVFSAQDQKHVRPGARLGARARGLPHRKRSKIAAGAGQL